VHLSIRACLAFLAALAFAGTACAEEASWAPPAKVALSDDGPILVTPAGMTLYTMGADDATPGKSICLKEPVIEFADPTAGFGNYKIPGYRFARACADEAPPFMAPAGAQPHGDWTLFARPEGGQQWVYRTHPLYTSVRDAKPGDRNGISMDQTARRGFRLAKAPTGFPPGLDFVRKGDQLVLATDDGRTVFTPRGAHLQRAAMTEDEGFVPVAAPALLNLAGDWSAVEAGAGRRQYAFARKPLFEAPEGMTDQQVLASADWEMVAFHKAAPPPDAIGTHYSPLLGDVYTTRAGRTLYIFACTAPNNTIGAPGCDRPGGPAAYWAALCGSGKECSRRWRPYLAESGARPRGEWSIVEVADPLFTDPAGITNPPGSTHVRAWAYRGRPVYTYYEDKAPGDIWGHMLRWFALSGFVAVPVPGEGSTP
jgi:predicted lipoprotein with Yx(FWY)xxD motif